MRPARRQNRARLVRGRGDACAVEEVSAEKLGSLESRFGDMVVYPYRETQASISAAVFIVQEQSQLAYPPSKGKHELGGVGRDCERSFGVGASAACQQSLILGIQSAARNRAEKHERCEGSCKPPASVPDPHRSVPALVPAAVQNLRAQFRRQRGRGRPQLRFDRFRFMLGCHLLLSS